MVSFERIYFDTEPLTRAGWPSVGGDVRNVFSMAASLDVSVFLPEAVREELEAHWRADLVSKIQEAQGKIRAVHDWLRRAGSSFKVPDPDVDRALESYRTKASAAIKSLGLRWVAMTSRTLDDVFQLALATKAPFHPKTDAGFKDMVILLSVVEHLERGPAASVLVTQDDHFAQANMHDLAIASDVPLRIITLETVKSELEAAVKQTQSDEWAKDRKLAEDAIVSAWEDLSALVAANLDRVQGCFLSHLGRMQSARPTVLVDVSTPFPPEHAVGQSVTIEGKLEVEVEWGEDATIPPLVRALIGDQDRVCVVTLKATATYTEAGFAALHFIELEPTYDKGLWTGFAKSVPGARPTKSGVMAVYLAMMAAGEELGGRPDRP